MVLELQETGRNDNQQRITKVINVVAKALEDKDQELERKPVEHEKMMDLLIEMLLTERRKVSILAFERDSLLNKESEDKDLAQIPLQ